MDPAGIFLFQVLSGVLQGCPLSGSIFALAADGFLRRLRRILSCGGHGVLRACADDIAVALGCIRPMAELCRAFAHFEQLSGLALKPAKCIILPMAADASSSAAPQILGSRSRGMVALQGVRLWHLSWLGLGQMQQRAEVGHGCG